MKKKSPSTFMTAHKVLIIIIMELWVGGNIMKLLSFCILLLLIRHMYEVYLKSNGTRCAVRAMDERGITGLCYHLT